MKKSDKINNDSSTKELKVTYHREGYIGFITLNRPEKRNAMDESLWEDLGKAVGEAEEDGDVRVVLLRGKGESFCTGLDLAPDNPVIAKVRERGGARQKEDLFRTILKVQKVYARLEQLPVPTIAVIHHHCIGAGLELALCCDIRLCTEQTILALPEARIATISDLGGIPRLSKVVGPGHAREIAFRGHTVNGIHAKEINLVNHIYKDREMLETQSLEMAEEIASNPPLAVRGTKDVFLVSEVVCMEQAFAYSAARSSMTLPSEDLFEAVNASKEKRKGKFKGA